MSLAKILLTLLAAYLACKLIQFARRRRRLVKLIERLPGPPNIPIAPLINHALVIAYLDSLRHRLGTYFLTYHVLSNLCRLFPDTGICRLWLGLKPIVILYSPENVEAILNSTAVINKADEYRFFEPWIGEGLVTSRANKWRFRRKILTPAFHFRILNDFLPIINEEATKLVRKLNQEHYLGHKQVFDITPVIALCTLDTICETAMGVNLNCQHDDQSIVYVQALKEVGEIALSRVTKPWLWPEFLFKCTEAGRRFGRANKTMHDFTTKVILDRRAEWVRQLKAPARSEPAGSDGKPDPNSAGSPTFDDLRASSFFTVGNKRLAFLDLMLHQHLIENTMSIDDIREEVDTFMFAGHDTTAMCISWTLYMLGLHENIQQRVRDEIDEVMADDQFDDHDELRQLSPTDCDSDGAQSSNKMPKSISKVPCENNRELADKRSSDYNSTAHDDYTNPGASYNKEGSRLSIKAGDNRLNEHVAKQLKTANVNTDQLRRMKYLDRVIKESLRMWPSIPFVARQMTEDILVDKKYLIPEGATCMVFTQALHNNPRYYPKPEVFDPDRFLPENVAERHPYAYVPFSAGPRNCIGQKFAQMEVKIILAKVIRNYRIKTVDHRDKLALVGELVLRSRNGLNISLEPRFT